MVFPSVGCHTCKKRRIKCDSIRPLCGRCRKASYSCTWDAGQEQGGLPFRSENEFAQGRPRRPWKRNSTSQALMTLGTTSIRSVVKPALSFPVHHHAVNYWVENFVFGIKDLPDIGHEFGSYVISHWNQTRPDSSLSLAVLAFTHAVFGRARRVYKAINDANRLFSQAMMKIKADVKNVSNEDIDQLLLAIMLIGSFENVMWGLNPHNPQNFSTSSDGTGSRLWQNVFHYKGAAGLLRLRQLRGIVPHLPLDKVVRRQLIRIIILRGGTCLPQWLQDAGYFEEPGPMRELDTLMLRLAKLRAKSMHLFQNGRDSRPKAVSLHCLRRSSTATHPQDIASEAEELDLALETWSKTVPDDWKFSSSPGLTGLDSPTTDVLHDCPIHVYTSHGHATVWNRYRAVRLAVNSIRIRALGHLLQCPMRLPFVLVEQDICQARIDSLANDLCGGVLFFFNAHDAESGGTAGIRSIKIGNKIIHTESEILPKMASLLAWPLTVAISTEGVKEHQIQWLRCRTKTVAHALGDAVLESVIERGEFKF